MTLSLLDWTPPAQAHSETSKAAAPVSKFLSVIGHRFGRLVALRFAGLSESNSAVLVDVLCDCGREKRMRAAHLANGRSRSCGLGGCRGRHRAATKAGKTPEYRAWTRMIERCYSPRHKSYADYGGRGIVICERWRHSFSAFLEDMGQRPSPDYSIDRINVNGNYEPDNCRWATSETQHNNTRASRFITFNGRTQTAAQWAREVGLSRDVLHKRLDTWPVERALTEPRRVQKNNRPAVTRSATLWAAREGVSP